jgi:hypothetical protein
MDPTPKIVEIDIDLQEALKALRARKYDSVKIFIEAALREVKALQQNAAEQQKRGIMLFKMIELPSDEPVQFVGVYVLRWGQGGEPTVGFREATPEEVATEQAKPEHEEPQAHIGE